MTGARLRFVDSFTDRHGKPRHYFRAGRGRRVRLPGEPGSAEFMAAYEAAAAGVTVPRVNNRIGMPSFEATRDIGVTEV